MINDGKKFNIPYLHNESIMGGAVIISEKTSSYSMAITKCESCSISEGLEAKA